ncbi:MAG: hypothetical protein ACRD24_08670 [Terriglobales bacterium]
MDVNTKLLDRDVRVGDECWIALALLHREVPAKTSFSPREILDRIRAERIHPELRPGIQPHIYQHNVANVEPSSARYRLFYKLEDGTLRLFRPGDDTHPSRRGKTKPEQQALPEAYRYLLDWYENDYVRRGPSLEESDPVLAMRGVGKEIWAGVDADAYVADLRSGWTVEAHGQSRGRARKQPAS